MQGIRRSGGLQWRPQARAAFTLAAIVAVLLQAFVVQTHVHARGPLAPAYEGVSGANALSNAATGLASNDAQACVLCLALAAGGRATLAANAALDAHFGSAVGPALLGLPHAPQALTHSWRSRAPPTSL